MKIIFFIVTYLTVHSWGQQNCSSIFSKGCHFNNVTYPDGEQLPNVCFNLTCTFNTSSSLYEWETDNTIDRSCKGCDALDDPHLSTFDGHHYDWHGICNYSLAQDLECPGNNDPNFGIFEDFVSCNGGTASCVDITTYKVSSYTVATIYHWNPPSLSVNEVPVSLTTTPQLVCGLPLSNDVHPLLAWKEFLLVYSWGVWNTLDCVFLQGIDFSVRACNTSLYINTTADYIRKLHGLCGFYSGIAFEDYMLRNCSYLSLTSPNIPPFAISWLTSQQSDKECESGNDPSISEEEICPEDEILRNMYAKTCEDAILDFPDSGARARLIADCANDCCRNPDNCESVWTRNEQDLALQAISFGLIKEEEEVESFDVLKVG